METQFIINNFNDLDIEEQKDIQDFIAGITGNFVIKENYDNRRKYR